MKKNKFIIFLLICSISLLGCNDSTSKNKSNSINDKEVISQISDEIHSYFRNEIVDESTKDNLPFMVIVENSTAARPQSGLSSADIIYETSAEGGIPRFIALFQQNQPDVIGPVRSVRPYFIDIAEDYNIPFAHCGGSEEALNEIQTTSSLMSINEISNSNYFWRSSDRVAPHNLYTSSTNLLKYISDNSLNTDFNVPIEFDDNFFNSTNCKSLSKIYIQVNSTYNTSYEFKDNQFIKYMDNIEAIDENNNKPLSFTNIIIQKTNIDLSSDNNHLNINLIGSGEGYICSNGLYTPVTWKRSSTDSKTHFYDENNNEVPLSSGKTIWNIIDNSSKISIE